MILLYDFLSCFSVMTLYQSQTTFMFPRHDSLSNDLHVLLYVSLYVSLYVLLYVFLHVSLHVFLHVSLSNDLHVFSSWLSTILPKRQCKKIMQKSEKFLYLALLMSSLNSWRIKLNWKYEQFNSSRVENVSNSTQSRFEFKMSTQNSTWWSVYSTVSSSFSLSSFNELINLSFIIIII